MGRVGRALERAAFNPDALPASGVVLIALIPPVALGLVFFKLDAAVALGIALAAGVALHLGSAWLTPEGRRPSLSDPSPVVASLIAVALVGPATQPAWILVAALLGGGLEVARRHWVPALGVQPGLLAFGAVWALSRGGTAAYLNPPALKPLAEPVRLWQSYLGTFGAHGAPIDSVRLYVGNVPGPVFATSLMAVVVGAAWLWYARRLSLLVVLAYLAGALVPTLLRGWDPAYQLLSGPLWLVAAYVLADRQSLPASRLLRPLVGFAAGLIGLAIRSRGVGIEGTLLVAVGVQLALAATAGAAWLTGRARRSARPSAGVGIQAPRPRVSRSRAA